MNLIKRLKSKLVDSQERQVAVRLLESLDINPSDYFQGIESARSGEDILGYVKPAVCVNDHGMYKPIKAESESCNLAVVFNLLPIGTQFWSTRFYLHNDGTLVFDADAEVYLKPVYGRRCVKLDKAVAMSDHDGRSELHRHACHDWSPNLQSGKFIPVVSLEHVTECIRKELGVLSHSE